VAIADLNQQFIKGTETSADSY